MDDEAVVSFKGLNDDFGIVDSRSTIWRKMAAGVFPRIINPTKHRNSHPYWWRRDIRDYLRKLGAA
jgi:predicted DNA-binding transcriptional regulator AlpA